MVQRGKVLSIAACAAVLIAVAAAGAGAAGGPAPVIPPGARVGGLTYGQWSAAQWRWEIGAPNDPTHQVVDQNPGTPASPAPVNCALGQSGNVWFLAGTSYAQPFTTTYRSCNVRAGKFLFFPLVDDWLDNLGCPGTPNSTLTADQLRTAVSQTVDTVDTTSLHASVDGQPVRSLTQDPAAFRAQANGFIYTLPANNALGAFACGTLFPAGTTPPPPGAFADGYYVMLPPLCVGTHQLSFGGTSNFEGSTFTEDIHYTITVTPG
jgi:hypothetical protein